MVLTNWGALNLNMRLFCFSKLPFFLQFTFFFNLPFFAWNDMLFIHNCLQFQINSQSRLLEAIWTFSQKRLKCQNLLKILKNFTFSIFPIFELSFFLTNIFMHMKASQCTSYTTFFESQGAWELIGKFIVALAKVFACNFCACIFL